MALPVLMRLFPAIIIAVFTLRCYSQQPAVPDTLAGKTYLYFREILDDDNLDSGKQQLYARVYLAKAKSRNDREELVEAYKSMLYVSKPEVRIAYADSMIYAARKTNIDKLIGSAYLTKGITYYGQNNLKDALDNYLLADYFISQSDDHYLIHKLKYNLAQTKYFLGRYESALALLKDCVSFYEQDEGTPWLNSLHHLGLCYTRLGKYDLSTTVNELGLNESLKSRHDNMVFYFAHSEGMNQYHRKNYELALVKLRQSLPELTRANDLRNEAVAYYYIAKSLVGLGQWQKAIPYLLKVDETLMKHDYTSSDLRDGIGMLTDYYASIGDTKTALRYSFHLRKADSILGNSFKNVSNKVHTTNDAHIDDLETEQQDNQMIMWSIGSIAFLSCATGGVLYRRNRQLKGRFQKHYDDLLQNGDVADKKEQIAYAAAEITPEKESELYASLMDFEQRHLYLGSNMTQFAVAKLLNTNTKYLIYIIKKYRNKMFVRYINDLKAEHAYRLLEKEILYRNFDQQSFAETLGFGTAQNLRRAFRKRYGFSTPFYIEQLRNDMDKGDPAKSFKEM
ncbi:tetratricopeptide repeat protein [Flavobacterium selenitireducens]|uniref:tetratricopeptide repeat protein n=1 Tax=Flavobacterium selenitireducens TaxID=2722704 RepID=UPI00168BABE1|nr:AraC family transcriptional regulator [Flavobacterium selenitireducens]MBD3581297.1 AraC family transcriptional regulator [Flavobacterium selenitireducens]